MRRSRCRTGSDAAATGAGRGWGVRWLAIVLLVPAWLVGGVCSARPLPHGESSKDVFADQLELRNERARRMRRRPVKRAGSTVPAPRSGSPPPMPTTTERSWTTRSGATRCCRHGSVWRSGGSRSRGDWSPRRIVRSQRSHASCQVTVRRMARLHALECHAASSPIRSTRLLTSTPSRTV